MSEQLAVLLQVCRSAYLSMDPAGPIALEQRHVQMYATCLIDLIKFRRALNWVSLKSIPVSLIARAEVN